MSGFCCTSELSMAKDRRLNASARRLDQLSKRLWRRIDQGGTVKLSQADVDEIKKAVTVLGQKIAKAR
jgi:hypothetical protein